MRRVAEHASHPAWVGNIWIAVFLAAAGGFLLDIATPGVSFWPASFIGIALLVVSFWGQKPYIGGILGLISGAFFWLPHISWLTLYLGPIPWTALSTVMIFWMALAGAAIATLTRWLPAVFSSGQPSQLSTFGSLFLSLAVAGVWVGRELVQASWPYGGFAWGRVATMLSSSPFAPLASWLGFLGLSGLMVFLVTLMLSEVRRQNITKPSLSALTKPTLVFVTLALLAIVPIYALPKTVETRVGAVQGNSDAGIFSDRQPGDILDDHLRASEALVGEELDFFVWPESALDLDPLRDAEASQALDEITDAVDAPLVTGVITSRGGLFYNSSVVWEQNAGIVDQYDKRRPVPFAEYMPNRAVFRALVPDLVDLVRLDYTAGDSSSIVSVAGIDAGIAICFDIIFDDLAVDMIDQGAELVLAQTNNADFGRTDESAQQLAIARLRAVEMGRTVVVISTVGTSAIVAPTGESIDSLTPFTPDAMIADVPLYEGLTPGIALGWLYTSILLVAGMLGLFLAVFFRVGRARDHQPRHEQNTDDS